MSNDPGPEFKPLPTTREQRGREIARRGGIQQLGARYVVPSQSANANAPTYVVDIIEQTCTCPDYATRRAPCKHYEACMFWLSWGCGMTGVANDETSAPTKKKAQSKQNWPAYNRAQTTERERVPVLLHMLCQGVVDKPRESSKPGQKPIPFAEAIFAIVMKVYSGLSGRRFESDLRAYVERGLLSKVWDSNTLFRVMEDPAITPFLTWMIEEAAGPLAQLENVAGQFAVDATGFRTTVRRVRDEKEVVVERWHDHKHKGDKENERRFIHDWVKLHAANGTLTNVVTAARVTMGTGKGSGDCPNFPGLITTTAKRFEIKEVSADKAYLDEDHLTLVASLGAAPFMQFKENSRGMEHPNEHWRRMWSFFDLMKDEFIKRYHRRSNVESTFGAIKAKFGAGIRSKKFVAQQNELLAKVLLWNLTCIIQAIEENENFKADFSRLVMRAA